MLHLERVNRNGSAAEPRTVACILNGSAGSNAASAAKSRVIELFKARGVEVCILMAEKGNEISQLTKRAIDNGTSVIVACGGDGTVNAVASVLIDCSAVLGVLPLGTLNHFARDIGVPDDLEAAVENVLKGRVARVDVGKVNGKIFLNNSSLGLYPAIVRQREEFQKRGHGKWLAFAIATLRAFIRYQRLYVRVLTERQSEIEEATPFIFIGNNKYEVCGLRVGERARVDAGTLWIYRAPMATRVALLRLGLHALRGQREPGELEVLEGKNFCIRTEKRHIHVATDGEVVTMNSPLNYSILPKKLCVIVPQCASAAGSS
jgi:YegS/Rv2252/BmrU family lipid kinase